MSETKVCNTCGHPTHKPGPCAECFCPSAPAEPVAKEPRNLQCEIYRAIYPETQSCPNCFPPTPAAQPTGELGTPKCQSPYHPPTSIYCLDCLPSDAPLGALLLSNRPPTADEIRRGLKLESLAKEALARNASPQPVTGAPDEVAMTPEAVGIEVAAPTGEAEKE